MKGWYIISVVLAIMYIILSFLNINKVQSISTTLTFWAAFSAIIGIVLYNKHLFTGTLKFFILAGLIGFPLCSIFNISGVCIKVLAKKASRNFQVIDNVSDVIVLDSALENTGSDFIKVFFTPLGILLNVGFWVVIIISK